MFANLQNSNVISLIVLLVQHIMTGNKISSHWKALVAIGCYLISSFGYGMLTLVRFHLPSTYPSAVPKSQGSLHDERRRWRLFAVFIVQIFLTVTVAAQAQIVSSQPLHDRNCFSSGSSKRKACAENLWGLLVIGLLAMDGAFQVSTSRLLLSGYLSSTGMLTIMIDFCHGLLQLFQVVSDAKYEAKERAPHSGQHSETSMMEGSNDSCIGFSPSVLLLVRLRMGQQ